MKVKLCGLRTIKDITYANAYLPDYAGFVFAQSRRQITPDKAALLCAGLDKRVISVGVFVDETMEKLIDIVKKTGMRAVQLHGKESTDYIKKLKCALPGLYVIKAVKTSIENEFIESVISPADLLLIDGSRAGSGKTADWDMIIRNRKKIPTPFLLAGGITPENVRKAMERVAPDGIDVSSGIETNGSKDGSKIKKLMELTGRGKI